MLRSLQALLFGTVRRQLILGVALVHAVMMTLFVWDLTVRQEAMLLERQTEHATALAQSMATSSAGWLAARDYYGLQEIVQTQSRYPELLYAMILDPRGQVVAHTDTSRLGQYLEDIPLEGADGRTRILSHTAELVDVISPVVLAGRQVGWVRVGLGQRVASQRLAEILRDGILYALAAILIGSLLAWAMGNRLTRRLHAIQAVADGIQGGAGHRRARVEGCDEAARLGHAFDAMLDTLSQRENELQQHRDHLAELVEEQTAELRRQQVFMAAVLDNISDGIVACDKRGRLSLFNRATRELHGIEHADLAPEHWSRHYRLLQADGATPMPIDHIPLFRAFNDESVREQPLVIEHVDGGQRQVLCTGQAMYDKAGEKLGAVISMRDVTEQKRIEADLIRAKEAAEAANRAKSTFLANMSHELRTPLNAILGFAQLMARDDRVPADLRGNLATIDKSGQHLLGLINDVLDISRIEAGRQSLHLDTVDLPELLDTLAEVAGGRARAKGLDLRLEAAPGLPRFIRSDPGKLRQILLNLLTNAVKYTDRGEVVLSAARPPEAGARLRFEVRDTGVGIAAADLGRIFQPFYQTEAGARLGDGAGLGLTISREFARLLGGELSATSQPGQGSVFRLDLPFEETAAPGASLAMPQDEPVGVGPARRILVAEDHADNRELIRQVLEGAGFELRLAGNGREALELFQSWPPDLVLMDMRMPVMDGYEATRALRARPGGGHLPILALTASAFDDDRAAILAAGCDDVLRKPIEIDALLARINTLLPRTPAASPPADQSAAAGPAPAAAPLTLAGQDPDWIAALRREAERLDMDAVRALVRDVRAHDPGLADSLDALLDGYDFDRLMTLCEATRHG